MTMGIAELAGASEEAIQAEHDAFAGRGLPGFGISGETDESMQHRRCAKCGKFEVR
jgi:hypothetical protein